MKNRSPHLIGLRKGEVPSNWAQMPAWVSPGSLNSFNCYTRMQCYLWDSFTYVPASLLLASIGFTYFTPYASYSCHGPTLMVFLLLYHCLREALDSSKYSSPFFMCMWWMKGTGKKKVNSPLTLFLFIFPLPSMSLFQVPSSSSSCLSKENAQRICNGSPS